MSTHNFYRKPGPIISKAEHRGGEPSRITTRRYSVTTSRHTNLAAKAMPEAVREEF